MLVLSSLVRGRPRRICRSVRASSPGRCPAPPGRAVPLAVDRDPDLAQLLSISVRPWVMAFSTSGCRISRGRGRAAGPPSGWGRRWRSKTGGKTDRTAPAAPPPTSTRALPTCRNPRVSCASSMKVTRVQPVSGMGRERNRKRVDPPLSPQRRAGGAGCRRKTSRCARQSIPAAPGCRNRHRGPGRSRPAGRSGPAPPGPAPLRITSPAWVEVKKASRSICPLLSEEVSRAIAATRIRTLRRWPV